MTLQEIIGRCGKMSVCEKRSIADDYCEFVFYSKDTGEWEKAFTDILGNPIKPPVTKPDRESARLANGYGGVRDGQSLFKKDFDDFIVIAIFWPWQDREHTTLKIALLKK